VNGLAVLTLALLTVSSSVSNADDQLVAANSTKKRAAMAARPLQVTMEMASQTNAQLKGRLLEMTELSVETAFGTATIPLHAVLGMRLPQKDSPMTTVLLTNGDSVTGTTELEKLFVHTDWGKAEVDAANVISIVFKEGLTWTLETRLNGERWTLIEQPQQVYYQY
jgi:hypothetical protein